MITFCKRLNDFIHISNFQRLGLSTSWPFAIQKWTCSQCPLYSFKSNKSNLHSAQETLLKSCFIDKTFRILLSQRVAMSTPLFVPVWSLRWVAMRKMTEMGGTLLLARVMCVSYGAREFKTKRNIYFHLQLMELLTDSKMLNQKI